MLALEITTVIAETRHEFARVFDDGAAMSHGIAGFDGRMEGQLELESAGSAAKAKAKETWKGSG